LKSEEERLTQKIREIDEQIKNLADERHLLQTDVAYLEKVLREELGFVKPGEIVYELVTAKNPSDPSRASSAGTVTSDTASTSVSEKPAAGKSVVSPKAAATSLARATPKVSTKKTSS
jgi:hypothetical protein